MRQLSLVRTCSVTDPVARSGSRRKEYVNSEITRTTSVTATTKPADVARNLRLQTGAQIPYRSVLNALGKLKGDDRQFHHDQWRQLPAYLERLSAGDPGAHTNVSYAGNVIRQLFIAPSTCRKAFSHVRGLFAVDGTFSKAVSDYIVLFATAYDANDHIIPLDGDVYGVGGDLGMALQ